jgi:CubicO group peptidase (beta-lactamase class C family)
MLFKAVDDDQSPAVSVAIVWKHEPVYVRSYGMADIEKGVKANADTAFPLASLTKQFTAYAVLMLAEQNKLSLDAPIATYLPELSYSNVTVRQLMNQVGGVPGTSLARYGAFSTATTADLLDMYKVQDQLVAEPGTQWAYQNSNYFLLDAIVQRVSRTSLAEYLHDQVFVPLGMTHSFFPFGPGSTHENRAYGYRSRDGAYQNVDTVDVYTDLTGAGGMYSSVQDLLRWDRAFYSSNAAAQGRREEGHYLSGEPIGYGAGLNVRHLDGVRSWEHGGTSGATSTYIAHYPEYGAAIIVLIASDRFRPEGEAMALTQQIRKLMFSRFMTDRTPEADAQGNWSPWSQEALASVVGGWFGEWNGRMQRLDLSMLDSGKLEVAMFDGFKATLKQVGDSKFSIEGHEEVEIALGADQITASDEGKTLATLHRIPSGLPPATPLDLAGYYTSPALNKGVWTLELRDGVMFATGPGGDSAPMPPFFGNLIGSNATGLFLELDDSSGPERGLVLRAGQVPPIRLTRTSVRPATAILKQAMEDDGAEAAWSKYKDMLKTPERYDFVENAMNALGYKLLQSQRPGDALMVFKMLVDSFPNSLNALDSLADGQLASGEREAAMATYERILSLQPNQAAAKQALQ